MHPVAGRSLVVVASLSSLSCAPCPASPTWHAPDAAAFASLRVQLAERRAARPTRPWAAGIHVVMREPRSGRTFEGRGALAVAPSRAVRMILLGGAGATMLDVWVSGQRWRVAIPALGVVRRGAAEAPDLPVGFLRWWFTEPLGGTLFAAEERPPAQLWLLRTPGAVVQLEAVPCSPAGMSTEDGLLATRRTARTAERVLECRAGAQVSAGDVAEYEDLGGGLKVRVQVESVSGTPPAEAFIDPDAPGALAASP